MRIPFDLQQENFSLCVGLCLLSWQVMSDLQPAQGDSANSPSPLIFIVDDEPAVGMMLEKSLRRQQYRTTVFGDPIAALASFQSADPKPDLLIVDFRMAGMTGDDLIRQCKTIHAPLKTILISGFSLDDDFVQSLVPKPDRFLNKPFAVAVLLNEVRALLAE